MPSGHRLTGLGPDRAARRCLSRPTGRSQRSPGGIRLRGPFPPPVGGLAAVQFRSYVLVQVWVQFLFFRQSVLPHAAIPGPAADLLALRVWGAGRGPRRLGIGRFRERGLPDGHPAPAIIGASPGDALKGFVGPGRLAALLQPSEARSGVGRRISAALGPLLESRRVPGEPLCGGRAIGGYNNGKVQWDYGAELEGPAPETSRPSGTT